MKYELIDLLQTLGHTCDLEESFVYSLDNKIPDQTVAEFLDMAREDRHLMANRGKMPNRTWDMTFERFLFGDTVAEFNLKCHRPEWPDESFVYGFELIIFAKIKKPR